MISAQIHKKVSEKFEGMEDVLTSSVFCLFRYLPHESALSLLSKLLGLNFIYPFIEVDFWPRYTTPPGFGFLINNGSDVNLSERGQTEPDVVFTTETHLIFIESKFYSDFDKEFDQLGREFVIGYQEAKKVGKEFILLVVTRDVRQPSPNNFDLQTGTTEKILIAGKMGLEGDIQNICSKVSTSLKWVNWQSICRVLSGFQFKHPVCSGNRQMIKDVLQLLEMRGLKPYDASPLEDILCYGISDECLTEFSYGYVMSSGYAHNWERLASVKTTYLDRTDNIPSYKKQYNLDKVCIFNLDKLRQERDNQYDYRR